MTFRPILRTLVLATLFAGAAQSAAASCFLFPFGPMPGCWGPPPAYGNSCGYSAFSPMWGPPPPMAGFFGPRAYSAGYPAFGMAGCCPTTCCPTDCCGTCGTASCPGGCATPDSTTSETYQRPPAPASDDNFRDRRETDPLPSEDDGFRRREPSGSGTGSDYDSNRTFDDPVDDFDTRRDFGSGLDADSNTGSGDSGTPDFGGDSAPRSDDGLFPLDSAGDDFQSVNRPPMGDPKDVGEDDFLSEPAGTTPNSDSESSTDDETPAASEDMSSLRIPTGFRSLPRQTISQRERVAARQVSAATKAGRTMISGVPPRRWSEAPPRGLVRL